MSEASSPSHASSARRVPIKSVDLQKNEFRCTFRRRERSRTSRCDNQESGHNPNDTPSRLSGKHPSSLAGTTWKRRSSKFCLWCTAITRRRGNWDAGTKSDEFATYLREQTRRGTQYQPSNIQDLDGLVLFTLQVNDSEPTENNTAVLGDGKIEILTLYLPN